MEKRFIVIILVLVVGSSIFYLPKAPFSDKEVFFRIEKGEGSKEIALNLQGQGLIWWSPLFRLYVLITEDSGKLQAGTYQLSRSMSIQTMAGKFSRGDVAKIKITIPEGFTTQQIKEKLKQTTSIDDVILQDYEGYLFPDTYEIVYGARQEEIIKMMMENFDRKTAGLAVTPEIVIMASLLEKEVKTKKEKELAAGILWKRLKIGMPLQVDAKMWTYDNFGLPSKPISNPGLESILAAIYPQNSDYWYYLSAPDGETIFSKTLEEHNIAKAKYLK